MTAPLVCTLGFGKKGPQGKRQVLPEDASPVIALYSFLSGLPSDGVESWWAGMEWHNDYRLNDNFIRAFVVPQDLDYYGEDGEHARGVQPPW